MKLVHLSNNVVTHVSLPESGYEAQSNEVLISDSTVVGPGYTYNGTTFEAPTPAADPYQWLIDIGPFFDRFDHFTPGTKIAVLSSTDVVVQAIVKDVQSRKWVTLTRADVAAAIDVLISKGISGVNSTLKTYIISTPAAADENLALRKVYFS